MERPLTPLLIVAIVPYALFLPLCTVARSGHEPMKNVVIIGATSAIAQAAARLYARRGDKLFIAARNQATLATLAEELRSLGASAVSSETFDAQQPSTHAALIASAISALGAIDTAVVAHGELPSEDECRSDWQTAQRCFEVNLLSPLACLIPLAHHMEQRGSGNITVISSVAGDRGRGSNYHYGSAKAGLSTYLQGLRNRLASCGVSVTTIKPGFVDTPMTAHLKKSPLFASPARVGERLVQASDRGEAVVYTPWYWRFIMAIIIHIPECIFKRLSL
jgi:decaprenylphospho-beta-D-erythro-pentofuranosid-2-ulose 2-reductase